MMPTTTETPGTSLGQTEVWVDRAGRTHLVENMDLRYKANVVRFLERNAPRLVGQAVERQIEEDPDLLGKLITARAKVSTMQCVLCRPADVTPHEWAHGVWHGVGPVPGSEVDEMLQEADMHRPFGLVIAGITDTEAITIIHATPLVKRLLADIEATGATLETIPPRAGMVGCGQHLTEGHDTYHHGCHLCSEANSDAPDWTI